MKFILYKNHARTPYGGHEVVLFPEHMTHSDVDELYRKSTYENMIELQTAGFYHPPSIVEIGAESMDIQPNTFDPNAALQQIHDTTIHGLLT